eukprot:76266-Alexandrium_andersonii.AAC.1
MTAALRNGALEGSGELLRRAPESFWIVSGEPLENWLKVTACDPAVGSQDIRKASLAGQIDFVNHWQ